VRIAHEAEKAAKLIAPLSGTFPTAEQVLPATLRVPAYLFREGRVVGKVDVTFHLAGGVLGVVFASWVPESVKEAVTLAPFEVDAFAAGLAGRLRVAVEALLADARQGGAGAVRLSADAEVLATLPAVAHAAVRPQLAARPQQADLLAQWLRATPYDRVVLVAPEATFAVKARGLVDGIVRAPGRRDRAGGPRGRAVRPEDPGAHGPRRALSRGPRPAGGVRSSA
jgi:hypothetical protein